eukprot:1236717-Karenia_brevis.AAC.1
MSSPVLFGCGAPAFDASSPSLAAGMSSPVLFDADCKPQDGLNDFDLTAGHAKPVLFDGIEDNSQ